VTDLQYQLETREPQQHFLEDKRKASKPASYIKASFETALSVYRLYWVDD
jgi:hypothetical protein